METRKVRAKVIMLPTKNKSLLHTHSELSTGCEGMGSFQTLKLTDSKTKFKDPDWDGNIPQHLYFTTDEEIKEGDWYIDDCNLIRQAVTSDKDYWDRRPTYKKIVATTDKSLGLPEPSQAFIQKYCELGGIDEVDIELKSSDLDYFFGDLKVDPIHNTVTIHSIKDSWSREEMFQLMDNYQNYLIETDRTIKSFEEWFNS